MRKEEINKFMLWLLGVFPSWKSDKAVTAIWASELPNISAEEGIAAVRAFQNINPSPFPPNVFEIKSKLRGRCNPKHEARIIFNALWEGNSSRDPEIKSLANSERAQRALRLVGGSYGQCLTAEKDWHEKRFVEIYEGLIEREAINEQGLLGCGRYGTDQGTLMLAERGPDLEECAGSDEEEGFGIGDEGLETE